MKPALSSGRKAKGASGRVLRMLDCLALLVHLALAGNVAPIVSRSELSHGLLALVDSKQQAKAGKQDSLLFGCSH